jgi:hypothetical protein
MMMTTDDDHPTTMYRFNTILARLGMIAKENNQLTNLLKVPPKEKYAQAPHTTGHIANISHQCDTLYLPQDPKTSDKYCLVVVDVATRTLDAQPMKDRDSLTVSRAIQKIYSRGILKKPMRVEIDPGSEFKGAFREMMDKMDVSIKEKLANRHRQQSVVETANQRIGKIVHAKLNAEELNTGGSSNQWVDILPEIVSALK